MAMIISDMIFDNPAFNDLPLTTPSGGRLMSSAPHVDGLIMVGTNDIDVDSANLVKTRNAKGDWSFNRTGAGAETYNIRITLDQLLRTGEKYINDLFGQDSKIAAPDKGIAVIDFFAIYSVITQPLTGATLRLGKTVYSQTAGGGVFTQTDLVAATAIQTAVTPAANQYTFQKVAGPSPTVFHKDDAGLIEIEFVPVLQNGSVFKAVALGAHFNFNYN